jgi:predicted nucleotidyltransferase
MATISSEQMAIYRQTAARFAQQDRERLAARYERASEVARRAAVLLRKQFVIDNVLLFGSLVNPSQFHWHSDIDLAVRGLPDQDYFRAVGRLQGIDPEFSIDLVRMEEAPPSLLAVIEKEGIPL